MSAVDWIVASFIGCILLLASSVTAYLRRRRDSAPEIEVDVDPDEERAARVVRLTVAAARVWPDAYVVVNESGARVLGAGGSLLAFGSTIDELEQVVRTKLVREATA